MTVKTDMGNAYDMIERAFIQILFETMEFALQ